MEDENEIELPSELHKMQSEKRIIEDGSRVCCVVIGREIDSLALMALLRKQTNKGVMMVLQPDDVAVIEHDLMEDIRVKDRRVTERQQKRGALDRTGTSPGATLGKKSKWWER